MEDWLGNEVHERLQKVAMLALNNAILLGSGNATALMNDPMSGKKRLHCIGKEFGSIIGADLLDERKKFTSSA